MGGPWAEPTRETVRRLQGQIAVLQSAREYDAIRIRDLNNALKRRDEIIRNLSSQLSERTA